MSEPAMQQSNSSTTNALLQRVRSGDQQALADLLARHRDRLRRMVRLRLDRRLHGQVDPSDVLREAHREASKRIPEYLRNPSTPFLLWLRSIAGQRLQELHDQHLGAQAGAAGQELSLYRGALPQATSGSLAAQLLGHLSSPSQAAVRAEMQIRLQETLNTMDAMDREVLALRHFEELNNSQTAAVLGIDQAAASDRYIRALKRLKEILSAIPGFFKH